MSTLIRFFVELCLLRRGPQDLPGANALLGLVLVVHLVSALLVGLAAGLTAPIALGQGLADALLTLGLLWLALGLTDRRPRFLQVATALFGAGALLGLFALAPLGLVAGAESRGETSLAGLPLLVLLFWSLLVTGHILRHGFDLRLGQGVLIAVAYNLLASALVNSLFPVPDMHLHILGICGTFMGGIALLARALGHRVTGSDANVYPPMSTQLDGGRHHPHGGLRRRASGPGPGRGGRRQRHAPRHPGGGGHAGPGPALLLRPGMAQGQPAARALGAGGGRHPRQDHHRQHARLGAGRTPGSTRAS